MKLSRERELKILNALNQLVPPVMRDARWFVPTAYRIWFRRVTPLLMDFKERAPYMTDDEYRQAYEAMAPYTTTLGTDLNQACLDRLVREVKGPTVLEVGCGEGLLAGRLAARPGLEVTATDIIVDPAVRPRYPNVSFEVADVTGLPFADGAFDTVVCAHTLEHVRDLALAVSELRRVARHELVIVVPMERPYRYTFNLHLQFFPYPHSLLVAMGPGHDNSCEIVGGDLYYVERR